MSNSGYNFKIHNDKFTAVLTGRTVKIFNKGSNDEAARFKDLKYAYRAAFNPVKNQLFVKSTEPWLAFYCLDTMSLLRKIRIKKPNNNPQDEGFCFSADGKYVLNLEFVPAIDEISSMPTCTSNLVKYDCCSFEEIERFFANDRYHFRVIERHNDGYLLAGREWVSNVCQMFFFDGKTIKAISEISPDEYSSISPYAEIYYQ